MIMGRSSTGTKTGVLVMGTAFVLTIAAVLSGQLHVQTAGLDVTMGPHAERGFVVQIDGLECPGKDCPVFAFDWTFSLQG